MGEFAPAPGPSVGTALPVKRLTTATWFAPGSGNQRPVSGPGPRFWWDLSSRGQRLRLSAVRQVLALLLAVLTATCLGCVGVAQAKRQYATGYVPCVPEAIAADPTPMQELSGVGAVAFRVTCKGVVYQCVRSMAGGQCTPVEGTK